MILVDTSVWIDFFRGVHRAKALSKLLLENEVFSHPWIIGELRLGHLGPRRQKVLADLFLIPQLPAHSLKEIEAFIEKERLYGQGLSLADVQLLFSVLTADCFLWSHDRQLHRYAEKYRKAYQPL